MSQESPFPHPADSVQYVLTSNRADGVTTDILWSGVAAAIPKESHHRPKRANFNRLAEHVSSRAPTGFTGFVVS